MPDPPKNPRPYGKCPKCLRKSRASVSVSSSGKKFVGYSATSLPRLSESDVKKVRTFRASDNEMKLLESGKLRLTVSNNRVTLAV